MDQEEKGTTVEDGSDEKDRALRDKMLATAREAQQLAQTKTLDKRDELCKLSAALAVLASASVSPFLSLFDLLHTLRWFFSGKNCKLGPTYNVSSDVLRYSPNAFCMFSLKYPI
jgi:hypothetical protein